METASSANNGYNQRRRREEEATVAKLLGADPWMRFDMWSARAWEAIERGVDFAIANYSSLQSDHMLDPRVAAIFHSAGVAQEFATFVNPLQVVVGIEAVGEYDSDEDAIARMMLNNDPE